MNCSKYFQKYEHCFKSGYQVYQKRTVYFRKAFRFC
jgi:hypothetical protein